MPVVVLARIKAKDGCEPQLERAIRTMIAKAQEKQRAGEPRYVLYRSSEEPGVLILLEHHSCDPMSECEGGAGELIEEVVGLIDGRPIVETLVELVLLGLNPAHNDECPECLQARNGGCRQSHRRSRCSSMWRNPFQSIADDDSAPGAFIATLIITSTIAIPTATR